MTDDTPIDTDALEARHQAADLTHPVQMDLRYDDGVQATIGVLTDGSGIEARIYTEETAEYIRDLLDAAPALFTAARDLGQARLELKAAHIAARHASDHAEQVTAERDKLRTDRDDWRRACREAHVNWDAARAEVERLRVSLEEASAVIALAGWRISPSHPAWVILDGFDGSGDACREMEGRGYTRSGTGGWHPPTPAAEPTSDEPAPVLGEPCRDCEETGANCFRHRHLAAAADRADREPAPSVEQLAAAVRDLRDRWYARAGLAEFADALDALLDGHFDATPAAEATPDEPAPIPCVAAELKVQHPAHAVGRPEADISCPGFPATPDEPAPDNVGDGDRWEDPRDTVGGYAPAPSRAPNCDAEDAPLYMGPDGARSCRCVVCARCGRHTGNSNQGHYWAFCRDQPLTRTTRKGKRVYNRQPHHFCCPPPHGCALDEDAQAEGEPAPSDPASLTEVVLMQEAHASVTLDGETVALGPGGGGSRHRMSAFRAAPHLEP